MNIASVDIDRLVTSAVEVRRRAYAPYSGFAVGAALLGSSGQIYVGCNVENLSFGLTVCAERAAVFTALGSGEREYAFLVIVSGSRHPVSPCGACRQVLAEFSPKLPIQSRTLAGELFEATLDVLLPRPREGILGE